MEYLTVSALTKYLKRKFDADPYLEKVFLTGEISNFRLRPNHQYFSIKDDHAKISAVMFKNSFSKLNFMPEEGMKVMVVGRISLYEASGNYQIYVEQMQPDGIGALYQAYEQLKKKLAAEGLFQLPKKTLPRFPKKIAVLTSPSGAVIRDIITTVKRRYPIVQLVLFPTIVQGDQAADNLVVNLKKVEQQADFDTVIIGRGGGSIEDLWPFNEERVARAIVDCPLAVISSVGHETDTTIADLVSDVRAATPTAAAELAVPVLSEEILRIDEKQARLQQAYLYQLQSKLERFKRLQNSYVFRQPQRLYEAQSQQLDQLKQRLSQTLEHSFYEKEKAYSQMNTRLRQLNPASQLNQEKQRLLFLQTGLTRNMQQLLQKKEQKFEHTVASLDLLSPLKIMSRGYNFTTKKEQIIKSVKELELQDQITVHYYDGQIQAQITNIKEHEDE